MHAAQPTAGRQCRRSRLDAAFLKVKAFFQAAFLTGQGQASRYRASRARFRRPREVGAKETPRPYMAANGKADGRIGRRGKTLDRPRRTGYESRLG